MILTAASSLRRRSQRRRSAVGSVSLKVVDDEAETHDFRG